MKIAQNLVKCTTYLTKSMEARGTSASQTMEFVLKVDECESLIDEDYVKLKLLFITTAEPVPSPILLILKDLVEAMEHASDMCDSTADYLRTFNWRKPN